MKTGVPNASKPRRGRATSSRSGRHREQVRQRQYYPRRTRPGATGRFAVRQRNRRHGAGAADANVTGSPCVTTALASPPTKPAVTGQSLTDVIAAEVAVTRRIRLETGLSRTPPSPAQPTAACSSAAPAATGRFATPDSSMSVATASMSASPPVTGQSQRLSSTVRRRRSRRLRDNGDWTVRNTEVRRSNTGVKAIDSGGNWTVTDLTVHRSDTGLVTAFSEVRGHLKIRP